MEGQTLLNLEEDLLRRAHGRLQVQDLDVLPVLLQQRHQKVDRQVDVADQLSLIHLHVTDCGVQAQHLLHLELDGGADLQHLVLQGVVGTNQGWELAGTVEAWSEQTWDLLDQGVRGQEGVVAASQLLHQLLVLVELLQVINGHGINTQVLGLTAVNLRAQDADLHVWAWHERQDNRPVEALVLGWVVVLQANLQLYTLHEVSLLALDGGLTHGDALTLGEGQNVTASASAWLRPIWPMYLLDRLLHKFARKFAAHKSAFELLSCSHETYLMLFDRSSQQRVHAAAQGAERNTILFKAQKILCSHPKHRTGKLMTINYTTKLSA